MIDFGGRFRVGTRVPGRPWYKVIWWDIGSTICIAFMKLFYRFRFVGEERVPRSGPVLFVSNHQSYYDPILNGLVVNRRQFTALAEHGLFKNKLVAWMLGSLGAIPVSATAGDKGALKAALKELEEGRCVLIYPEGTRCNDGYVAQFKRGTTLLLRRSNAVVLPMGIEGAYDVWPRTQRLPRFRGLLTVVVGTPHSTAELLEEGPEKALELLRTEIDRLRLEARTLLRERSGGRWPRQGPGDGPSPD